MAGQSGLDGDIRRFMIANLADHHHVGVVAQNAAQRLGKADFVRAIHFALSHPVNGIFDGVFNGHDVELALRQQHSDGGV